MQILSEAHESLTNTPVVLEPFYLQVYFRTYYAMQIGFVNSTFLYNKELSRTNLYNYLLKRL